MKLNFNYIFSKGTKRSFPENSTTEECSICFEEFNEAYGQLSDCNHVFCVTCIRDWFKTTGQKSCPVCRKDSAYIVYWPELISSKTVKNDIFYKQALAIDNSQREAVNMVLSNPTTSSSDNMQAVIDTVASGSSSIPIVTRSRGRGRGRGRGRPRTNPSL